MRYFKVRYERFNKKGKVVSGKPMYKSVDSDDIFTCLNTILFEIARMRFHPYKNREIENYIYAHAKNLYEFKEKHVKYILEQSQRIIPVKKGEDQYYIFYYEFVENVEKDQYYYHTLDIKEIKVDNLEVEDFIRGR